MAMGKAISVLKCSYGQMAVGKATSVLKCSYDQMPGIRETCAQKSTRHQILEYSKKNPLISPPKEILF